MMSVFAPRLADGKRPIKLKAASSRTVIPAARIHDSTNLLALFIAGDAKVRVRQPLSSETRPNSSQRRMTWRARETTAEDIPNQLPR